MKWYRHSTAFSFSGRDAGFAAPLFVIVAALALSGSAYGYAALLGDRAQPAAVKEAITGDSEGDHIKGSTEYGTVTQLDPGAVCLPASEVNALRSEIAALKKAAKAKADTAKVSAPDVQVPATIQDLTNAVAKNLGTLPTPEDLRNYGPVDIPEIVDVTDAIADAPSLFDNVLGEVGKMCTAALEGFVNSAAPIDSSVLGALDGLYASVGGKLSDLLQGSGIEGAMPDLSALDPDQLARFLSIVAAVSPEVPPVPGLEDAVGDLPFSDELIGHYANEGLSQIADTFKGKLESQMPRLIEELKGRRTDRQNPPDVSAKTCAEGLDELRKVARERSIEWPFVCLKFEDGTEQWSLVCTRMQTDAELVLRVECLDDILKGQWKRVVEAWDVHTHPPEQGVDGEVLPPSPKDLDSVEAMRRYYANIPKLRFFAVDPQGAWEYGLDDVGALIDKALAEYSGLPEVKKAFQDKLKALKRKPTEEDLRRMNDEVFKEAVRGALGAKAQAAARKTEVLADPNRLSREMAEVLNGCGYADQNSKACADKILEVYKKYGITVRRAAGK